MKKKGFTLIELLAVIIVLAVIALITVPVITNLIGMSKKKAFESKMYALVEAAETYYEKVALEEDEEIFKESLEGTPTLSINLSNKEEVKKLNIKTFKKGLLTITDNGEITVTAIEDNLCGEKTPKSKVVNMLDIKKDFSCYFLNSSTTDIGTQDILTAINNLKSSNQELISSNEKLTKKVNELSETVKILSNEETSLNKVYPVGSIYISTTLKTKEEVKNALGGQWEVYGDGKVLRSSTEKSEQTGGSSTVSLTTANLPSHNHAYTPSGSVSSTFTGTSVYTSTVDINHRHDFSGTTSSNGEHTHNVTNYNGVLLYSQNTQSSGSGPGMNYTWTYGTTYPLKTSSTGAHTHTYSGTTGYMKENNTHNHKVTAAGTITSSFTGTATNTGNTGSNTAFSVLDPYITVYMYKRVK